MKIAIISDAIYPYNKGGKEKRIYEVSTRLAKNGNTVTIYCMKWWEGKNERVENGVRLKAISNLYPLYSGERRSIKQAIIFSLSCFKLIKEDFDVIDADHMPHLVLFPLKLVCIIKRKKLIVTWNEVWGRKYWVEYMGISGNIAGLIEKLSSYTPDTVISVSDYTAKRFINELNHNQKVVTITNGIDFNKIQKIRPSDTKSDLIFGGRLLKHKNVDLLIKSIGYLAKKNSKIKCIIVGEGPERKSLEKLTKELKLTKNITFVDFLPDQNDLYSLFKSSKVFVFPSTREGFGIVALEANACGIPAVVVNHKDNATKDLINKKNGLIVTINEKNISNAVFQLLKHPIGRDDCIYSSKQFDWDEISNGIERIYL